MDKKITNRMLTGLARRQIWFLGWDMVERGASSAEVVSVVKRWEKINNAKCRGRDADGLFG